MAWSMAFKLLILSKSLNHVKSSLVEKYHVHWLYYLIGYLSKSNLKDPFLRCRGLETGLSPKKSTKAWSNQPPWGLLITFRTSGDICRESFFFLSQSFDEGNGGTKLHPIVGLFATKLFFVKVSYILHRGEKTRWIGVDHYINQCWNEFVSPRYARLTRHTQEVHNSGAASIDALQFVSRRLNGKTKENENSFCHFEKISWFCDLFLFNDTAFTAVKRNTHHWQVTIVSSAWIQLSNNIQISVPTVTL